MALFPIRNKDDTASSADANSAARQNFDNDGSVPSQQNIQAAVSGAVTVDSNKGEYHKLKVTGAVTGFTVLNAIGGTVLYLRIEDTAGPHAWVYTGTTVKKAGGAATYSTTSGAGNADEVTLIYDEENTQFTEISVQNNIS